MYMDNAYGYIDKAYKMKKKCIRDGDGWMNGWMHECVDVCGGGMDTKR